VAPAGHGGSGWQRCAPPVSLSLTRTQCANVRTWARNGTVTFRRTLRWKLPIRLEGASAFQRAAEEQTKMEPPVIATASAGIFVFTLIRSWLWGQAMSVFQLRRNGQASAAQATGKLIE